MAAAANLSRTGCGVPARASNPNQFAKSKSSSSWSPARASNPNQFAKSKSSSPWSRRPRECPGKRVSAAFAANHLFQEKSFFNSSVRASFPARLADAVVSNFMTRSSRRGPIAKTGATLRSVRKKLQGRVRGAAGDLPAEADEPLAAASALLWWCDCNVNSEKRRAEKAPSRLYGTGSWAGGNRGRRAGEDGSWLFPVKGIPAHSAGGASTRKTRAWFMQAKRPRARVTARRPCLLTRRRRLRRDKRFLRASTIASRYNNPKQLGRNQRTQPRQHSNA